MSRPKKIAFYAPIKPPDHPIPSGDRLIAGNLMTAFTTAGYEITLASRTIAYSKRSQPEILAERKAGAITEAERIIADYRDAPNSALPDIWITYHPYCKAPDWIGPLVSRALSIPYVTIEAARTGQGVNNEWGPWRAQAQAGLIKADRHLCFKPTDWAYLSGLLGGEEKLRKIPAFLDTKATGATETFDLPTHWNPQTPVLVTTGMMRKGKKEKNFQILAEVLAGMTDAPWNLVVIGSGPQEAAIKAAFGRIAPARILWCGQLAHEDVLGWMRSGSIFVWPGWKEPIGMVYLEAQLQGLPVAAFKSMGVPLVVAHGKTGLLCTENDIDAMRGILGRLLKDTGLRSRMARAARKKVLGEHSIQAAAKSLHQHIEELF